MTIEAAIAERLKGLTPVSALVGARVYQLVLRQGSILPAIRVQRVSGTRDYHLRGRTNLKESRIQVDVYASSESGSPYATPVAVAAAVSGDGLGENATGLDGFKGDIGGSPPTVRVEFTRCTEDGRPEFEPDDLKQVRIRMEYRIRWKEL